MSYIFFGWLLVLLHLRINGFDILPDFPGYLLIFAGVSKLSAASRYFGRARFFALLMGVVSFVELLPLETVTLESGVLFMLLTAVNLLLSFVSLYLMYLITQGVGQLERDTQVYLGAKPLMQVWKLNLIATLLIILLLWIATILLVLMNMGNGILVLSSLLMVCMFVINVLWVVCFYGAKKRYAAIESSRFSSEMQPQIQTKSALMALAVCMLIGALVMVSYSDYAFIMRDGICYVERSDHYRLSEYSARDSDTVVIDWKDAEASIGQEIYNDGECVIYISEIIDDKNGGYDIFFKTKGNFGYQQGRLVTPLSHMDDRNLADASALQGIHQNWPNDAVLQVRIGDKTYLSKKWCARAQSFDKDGDEIGYPMFAIEYYERGEMILADEIRRNDNRVALRLIGLREVLYERW